MEFPRYAKTPWPETARPPGEPSWFFFEIDAAADSVVRSVWVYPDGTGTRNSLEIEGISFRSLIDCSLERGFEGVDLVPMTSEEFEAAWAKGVDTPFWNIGQPPTAASG